MKTNTTLALLFAAFVSVQACAQTVPANEPTSTTSRWEKLANTTPEQRAERQTAQMKKQLSLTTEQEPTVAAINLKYAQQMQSVLETGERNRTTMKQVRDMTASKDAELKTVFTADQYKQYDAFKDEQKDRMKQNRGRRNNR
ncbi:MAG: hypothetical protein H7Z72_13210 [Bacteroidetes bacterium]|nr:hypothetical protein [Fibrella sp.]